MEKTLEKTFCNVRRPFIAYLQARAAMVKEVASKEEFDKILSESGDKLIVSDYTATWCG